MTISLSDLGKRFNRDWIFRRLTYEFSAGNSYALIGPNGSGKSTLLQVIGGALFFNEGTVRYRDNTSQALEFLEEEMAASDERDEIVTFIRESNRGIIKRFTKGATDDDLSV